MITCLAIDDEPLALKQLESYIKKVPFLELKGSYPSAAKALEYINSEPIDAIDSYKVQAVDYLLKPFGFDDFQRAANKVKEQYDFRHEEVSDNPEDEDAIFFKTDYKVVRVSISQIIYIEGMSEYLKIHTTGARQPLVVLLSFKKLEDRLPSGKFMRIHKSFLINLDKIKEVTKGHVLMTNDVSLPIGDSYKDAFSSWLGTKFLGK